MKRSKTPRQVSKRSTTVKFFRQTPPLFTFPPRKRQQGQQPFRRRTLALTSPFAQGRARAAITVSRTSQFVHTDDDDDTNAYYEPTTFGNPTKINETNNLANRHKHTCADDQMMIVQISHTSWARSLHHETSKKKKNNKTPRSHISRTCSRICCGLFIIYLFFSRSLPHGCVGASCAISDELRDFSSSPLPADIFGKSRSLLLLVQYARLRFFFASANQHQQRE